MADLISYEELRKVQNAERNNTALQQLEPSFFEKVRAYISTKKKLIRENESKDNTFALQTVEKGKQELKNIEKIIDDICSRRQKKILMQAITNLTARVHNTEMMLSEEEELYNRMIELLKLNSSLFIAKFSEISKNEIMKGSRKLKLIRITDDVPPFVWTDERTYGPFRKEDVTNMPHDICEILIKQGKATEIVENNGEQKNENAEGKKQVLSEMQEEDAS